MADEASLSSSITTKIVAKGSHELVIENYSLCKGMGVNKPLESQEFNVGGHDWMIRLYPDGKDQNASKDGFISVYLSLESRRSQDVAFFVQFYLLDQSSKANHLASSSFKGISNDVNHLSYGSITGHNKFIKHAALKSSDYLKNDCLRVRCVLEVLVSDVLNVPVIKIPPSDMKKDFGALLESREGVDVVFIVDGQKFEAHRCILAAHSRAFGDLFSEHQDRGIPIPDLEPSIFEAIVRFVYTGDVEPCDAHALDKIIAAADRFKLASLKAALDGCETLNQICPSSSEAQVPPHRLKGALISVKEHAATILSSISRKRKRE